MSEKIDQLVKKYIMLRDKLKESDDAHKAKTKPARELLEKMNGDLLEALRVAGGDSVSTEFGTVYKTTKKSATLLDADAFRNYVISNKLWDLADWKANSTAVSDYIDANTAPPPGVNYSTTFLVGVRRK